MILFDYIQIQNKIAKNREQKVRVFYQNLDYALDYFKNSKTANRLITEITIQRIMPRSNGFIPIFLRFWKDNPVPMRNNATLSEDLEKSTT